MKIIVKSDKQKFYAVDQVKRLGYDKIHTVKIEPYSPNRSLAQNSLFHKWLTVASEQHSEATGEYFTPEAWKVHFKQLFLGLEVLETPIGQMSVLRHTSDLKTKEMAEFMTKVDHYCGEHNIQLPHPMDYQWIIGGRL